MALQRRLISGLILLVLPWVAVYAFKQTTWGPVAATPMARIEGDPGAKVNIVEYSDFQCPSCAHIQPTLKAYMDTYKGKVRLAYKYFPLTMMHKNSLAAAHAAQCAAEQNKFWPYQDQLFSTQLEWENLTDPATNFMAIGAQVQLDANAYASCYADPSRLEVIKKDMAEGQAREVNATPTFFVGDERLVGTLFATSGAQAIERELRK